MESENGTVTTDVDSVSTDDTSSPDTSPDSGSPPAPSQGSGNPGVPQANGQARRSENAIPHHRVEEMRRRDREEAATLRRQVQQYEAVLKRVNGGIEAMGRGFGFIKDEAPQYVDQQAFDHKINSLKQSLEAQYREEMLVRELQSEWRTVSVKHNKWSAVPGFKEACLNAYANNPAKDLSAVADEIATQYGKLLATQQADAAAAAAANPAPKVVKPGGGTGAPVAKERKGALRERVQTMLRAKAAA